MSNTYKRYPRSTMEAFHNTTEHACAVTHYRRPTHRMWEAVCIIGSAAALLGVLAIWFWG